MVFSVFSPHRVHPTFMLEPPLNPGSGPSLMAIRVGVEPAVVVQMLKMLSDGVDPSSPPSHVSPNCMDWTFGGGGVVTPAFRDERLGFSFQWLPFFQQRQTNRQTSTIATLYYR